jgi:hypothetical protein
MELSCSGRISTVRFALSFLLDEETQNDAISSEGGGGAWNLLLKSNSTPSLIFSVRSALTGWRTSMCMNSTGNCQMDLPSWEANASQAVTKKQLICTEIVSLPGEICNGTLKQYESKVP